MMSSSSEDHSHQVDAVQELVPQGDVKFACEFCSKSFSKRSCLTQHIRRNHKGKKFQCFYCGYEVKVKFYLIRHMKKHLKENTPAGSYRCVLCQMFVSSDRKTMIEHYIQEHELRLSESEFTLADMHVFSRWKSEVEATDVCRFVASRGLKNKKDSRIRYFRCFREGNFQSVSKGKRRLKRMGSVKMGGVCPASIKAVEDKVSATVHVTFVNCHVGHCQELRRLYLTKDEKCAIARMLAADASGQAIIHHIRQTKKNGGDLHRLHLTTRKDLWNIRRSLKLDEVSKSFQRTSEEALSRTKNAVQIEEISKKRALPETKPSKPYEPQNYINEKKTIIRAKVEEILEDVTCDKHVDILWNGLLPITQTVGACSPSTVVIDFSPNSELPKQL